MRNQRDSVFPKHFQFAREGRTGDVIEKRVLFGDLVERVERRMANPDDGLQKLVSASERNDQSTLGPKSSWEHGNPDSILPGWGVGTGCTTLGKADSSVQTTDGAIEIAASASSSGGAHLQDYSRL